MPNPVTAIVRTKEPTIAVTASSAYSSGDVIGGEIELTKMARQGGAIGLDSILVRDEDVQDPIIDFLFFDENPAGTFTDHEACPDLGAADTPKVVAHVRIAASDYETVGSVAHGSLANLGRLIKLAKGATSLWMVMVLGSTPTFTATDHLSVVLGYFQD